MLRKDFAEATRGDIEALVGRIERSHLSPWTKQNYKVALKGKDRILPSKLLTEEDVMRLVETAANIRIWH